jgi:hypothetical protein
MATVQTTTIGQSVREDKSRDPATIAAAGAAACAAAFCPDPDDYTPE